MAVIDRDGLLYGDRLGRCSDSAQLWFPRYFASSNTCARFELNYEKLKTTVFASLKKKPTENEFWNHMVDYHKNYLLYTYQVNGVVWGQWWTAEHFLQKYPLKADERTPQPPDEQYATWKSEYAELKKTISPQPVDLNTFIITDISKDFKKLSKISSGVGGGVGEGIGIGRGTTLSQDKPATDPRLQACVDSLKKYWDYTNPNLPFKPTGKDIKNLKVALADYPQATAEQFHVCLQKRARDPAVKSHSAAIYRWIGTIFEQLGKSNHGQHSKAQQRTAGNITSIAAGLGLMPSGGGRALPDGNHRADSEDVGSVDAAIQSDADHNGV
jgi:hypothetical protein